MSAVCPLQLHSEGGTVRQTIQVTAEVRAGLESGLTESEIPCLRLSWGLGSLYAYCRG